MSRIYYNLNLDIAACDITLPLREFADIDVSLCAVHLDDMDVCLTTKLDCTLGFSRSNVDIIHRDVKFSYNSDEVYHYLNLILLNASERFLK